MNGLIEIGDKVVLYGFFDGFAHKTDGTTNGLVTLKTGERVEIPLEGIMKKDQIITKKDIISRMKQLFPNNRIDWINGILHEFGDDFGLWKYKAGYERGKLEGTVEREKVVVPQFVADWYEENKDDFEGNLFRCAHNIPSTFDGAKLNEFERWFLNASIKAFQILVNMHQFGYTVEEEKRYRVKIIGITDYNSYLNYRKEEESWTVESKMEVDAIRTGHTRKELEEAGFGWVFDCPGMEVEEVEE